MALLDEQLGILAIQSAALGLNIRTDGTAHIGAFIMGQTTLVHGAVDQFGCALNLPSLIRVFQTEDKGSVGFAGDQPSV